MKFNIYLTLVAGISAIRYENTPSYFYLDLDDEFDEEINEESYGDGDIDASINLQLDNIQSWDEKKLAEDEEDEVQFNEYGSGDLWEFSTLQLNNKILIDAQNRVKARWEDAELPDLGYDEDEDF